MICHYCGSDNTIYCGTYVDTDIHRCNNCKEHLYVWLKYEILD